MAGKAPKQSRVARATGILKLTYPSGTIAFRAFAPGWTDARGRRVGRASKAFDTLAEAKAWQGAEIARSHSGFRADSGRLTVEEFLRGWLDRLPMEDLAPSTVRFHRDAVSHVVELIGRKKLRELTTRHVTAVYAHLHTQGVAISYVHRGLHRALRDAVATGLILVNPASTAQKPRKRHDSEAALNCWDDAELCAFLASQAEGDLYPAYHVAAYTGLRRGELLGLAWPDVDLEKATLTVRRNLTPENGVPVLRDVKTKGSRRTIELDDDTIDVLSRHYDAHVAKRRKAGALWTERRADFVFTQRDGRPLDPRSFSRRFDRAVARAGLRRITVHGLRHTHATSLIRHRESPVWVSKRLGHADVGITLQVYSHAFPGDGADPVRRFAERMKHQRARGRVAAIANG